MRPITLAIEGLNSFEKEQHIDFEQLSRFGLFGIFGPTGSGKSTIIDGITLALYGEIPRYDKDRRRLNQCVNTFAGTLYVSFTFQITNKRYTCRRRLKKKENGLTTQLAGFYVENPEGQTVIADNVKGVNQAVTETIGLSYDDFVRSVVLPQGQFSKFLLLANQERGKMLERIFQFEEYGEKLANKTRAALSEAKYKKEQLEQQLLFYEGLTREAIAENKERYTVLTSQTGQLEKEWQQQQEGLKEITGTITLLREQEEYTKSLQALEKEKPAMDKLAQQYGQAKKAAAIEPFLTSLDTLQKSYDQCITEATKTSEELAHKERIWKEAGEKANAFAAYKAKEYPLLLAQESRCKQAADLWNQLTLLQEQRTVLREAFQGEKQKLNKQNTLLNQLQAKINHLETHLSALHLAKQKAAFSPEEREKLILAHTLWGQYANLNKQAGQLLEQQKVKRDAQPALESQYTGSRKKLAALQEELAAHRGKLDELNRHIPVSLAQLLEKQAQVVNLESGYAQFQTTNREYEAQKEKVTALAKAKLEQEKNLQTLFESWQQQITLCNQYKEREKERELSFWAGELAKGLAPGNPCPVCGAVHHPLRQTPQQLTPETPGTNQEQPPYQALEEAARKNWEEANNKLQNTTMQWEANRENLDRLQQQLQGKTLDWWMGQIEAEKNIYAGLNNSYQQWEADKNRYNKAIHAVQEKISPAQSQCASLEQILNQDREQLAEWEQEIEGLKKQISGIVAQLKTMDFTIDSIPSGYQNMLDRDKLSASLEVDIANSTKELDGAKKEHGEVLAAIASIEKEMERILTEGNGKKDTIQMIETNVRELTGGQFDPQQLETIRDALKKMGEEEEALTKAAGEAETKYQDTRTRFAQIQEKQKTLQGSLHNKREEVTAQLKEQGFTSRQDCLHALAPPHNLAQWDKTLQTYEGQLLTTTHRLKQINNQLQPCPYRQLPDALAKQKQMAETVRHLREQLDEQIKKAAILKEQIEKDEIRIVEVEKWAGQLKDATYQESLLKDIATLLAGNKFAEYLSTKQLRYITLEGGKRLKAMTRGRYCLELSGTEFVIRDDFNGGIRRSPKTLSGGETFLASLCLALALSSKIQMKSGAPLEFFFLDEGFGSLDNHLLDTVMEALEKLRDENFCVGVITHVEELKNRIPAHLNVIPPKLGSGGSKVEINI